MDKKNKEIRIDLEDPIEVPLEGKGIAKVYIPAWDFEKMTENLETQIDEEDAMEEVKKSE